MAKVKRKETPTGKKKGTPVILGQDSIYIDDATYADDVAYIIELRRSLKEMDQPITKEYEMKQEKDARFIEKNEYGVEIRYSTGHNVWPGWMSVKLKRGHWRGSSASHEWCGSLEAAQRMNRS